MKTRRGDRPATGRQSWGAPQDQRNPVEGWPEGLGVRAAFQEEEQPGPAQG